MARDSGLRTPLLAGPKTIDHREHQRGKNQAADGRRQLTIPPFIRVEAARQAVAVRLLQVRTE